MKRLLLVLLALSSCSQAFAGRDFDGTNDNISFGSDASIDAFARRTACFWIRKDAAASQLMVFAKGSGTEDVGLVNASDRVRYVADWTTDGNWIGTTDVVDGTYHYLCYRYNNAATTEDAEFFVDGTAEALTTDTAPTGSVVSDAANSLLLGETSANALDLDGNVGWFLYDDSTLSTADINRARWWGRPKGGLAVYMPFVTDKLTNEGDATANGTATNTTVVLSAVPVQRPAYTLFNGGVGW